MPVVVIDPLLVPKVDPDVGFHDVVTVLEAPNVNLKLAAIWAAVAGLLVE